MSKIIFSLFKLIKFVSFLFTKESGMIIDTSTFILGYLLGVFQFKTSRAKKLVNIFEEGLEKGTITHNNDTTGSMLCFMI
jgi:hypothetical protein